MSFAAGVVPQLEVLNALVLRETRTRFGTQQLGYLWAFIEPGLWIATFYVMFSLVGREPPLGMSIVGFIATGLAPFIAFRETAKRALNAVDANKSLLFYPQVRPLDLVLARTWLEVATLTTVLGILLSADVLVLEAKAPQDLLLLLIGMLAAAALGSGLGMSLGAVSVRWPTVERLFAPAIRPMFWVSGVFFTANSLPAKARDLMLYNPVLHVVELTRDGLSPNYEASYASPMYVLGWALALWALGLTLERVSRRRLEVT